MPDVEKPARCTLHCWILFTSRVLVQLHPIGVIETPPTQCDKALVRMLAARILAVLGVILALLSLLAGYVRFQGLDTDTVTGTAGDLIADDEIRDQVAASLVDALYTNIDVAAALEQRLPPDQKGLAGPAAAGLREFSDRAAARMLERPRVQALWVNTVTQAHRQLINVLDDDIGALSTENGAVVLNLQPLVIQLGERVAIVGDVAERLGPDAGRVEIMEAEQLETAQDLTRLLKFLGIVALARCRSPSGRSHCGSPAASRRSILRTIAVGTILARAARAGAAPRSAARSSSTSSCRRRPCSLRPTTPGTS